MTSAPAEPERTSTPGGAWSGDSPLRAAAEERLLDATTRCIERDGTAAVSIASVALEAGVSRPTVYRYFKDRSALVRAALLRGGAGLARALDTHLRGFAGAGRKTIEAQLFVIDAVPGDPLLSEAWRASVLDADVLADFTTPQAIALARHGLRCLVDEAGWDDAEADEAVEFMLRVLLTLLVAPGDKREPRTLRPFLERRLLPGLGLVD
jgi:AcrR family transcriptional regulator